MLHYTEIALIGLALAVDATVYSFSYGLVLRSRRVLSSLLLALTVGGYQFAMPLLGYAGGSALRDWVSLWAPWIVLAVFCLLGGSVIRGAWCGGDEEEEKLSARPLGFWALMAVGIATAIDALAVGGCMALGNMGGENLTPLGVAAAAGIIGIITFVCSLSSFHAARLLHRLPTRWLETAAGLLLIGLGVQQVLA